MLDISYLFSHAWLESCQFSSFGPTVPTLQLRSGLLVETITLDINLYRSFSVLMQWAEGGRSVQLFFSLFTFQCSIRHFTSLDDFIDARLGRKPANVHLHHLFDSAPNSAPPSSRASTRTSAPPDSPTLATQSLMSDGTAGAPITATQQTNKHAHLTSGGNNEQRGDVPQSTQDPLSRSARIRAFRAFQQASPEEKERMRGNWVGAAAGTDGDNSAAAGTRGGGGEWTAVHLLSADEVKSLFKDVVEGLRFLVLNFFCLCFNCGSLTFGCVAFYFFHCSIVNRYYIWISNLGMFF